MRTTVHWLKAFTLCLGFAAVVTLAAYAKLASKYFANIGILGSSIISLADGYEEGMTSISYPFHLVMMSQRGHGERKIEKNF